MDERPQFLRVLAAQSVTPLTFEAFNQLTAMFCHAFPFALSLGPKQKKASRCKRGVALQRPGMDEVIDGG